MKIAAEDFGGGVDIPEGCPHGSLKVKHDGLGLVVRMAVFHMLEDCLVVVSASGGKYLYKDIFTNIKDYL